MKKLLACVMLTMTGAGVYSQLPDYASAPIPETLLKNANRVTRYENTTFEVKGIGKAVQTTHSVVTVLNKDAQSSLTLNLSTDKFHHFEDADIRIYDALGRQVAKYKKKDFVAYAIPDGLVDDGKNYYFAYSPSSYPVTIEFKYEYFHDGTLGYPSFYIQSPNEAVMHSEFTAKVPKDLDLRHREKNVKLPAVVTETGSQKTYHWSVKNLAASDYESGSISDVYPRIELAPNKFSYGDFDGDMTSWKNYGIWYNKISKGTDKLPEDRKAFYRNMVKDATTDNEKIKLVYDYLQKNFRYVSIQLGIGGLRPIPADFTDAKKYGDCKGLSNLMKTVLTEIGIKSHLAVIYRDAKPLPVENDFPLEKFNHVFLCVPQKKDTLWFECTSKTLPFATLDISTRNRKTILLTDEGGVVVSTPASQPGDNIINVRSLIALKEDGSGSTVSDISATGEYSTELSHYLFDEKKDDQKRYLVRGMGYKQPDDFSIIKKDNGAAFASSVSLTIEKIPEFTAGSKMFLAPCPYKFWTEVLPKADNRKNDYYFECPFRKTDTTVYKLPEGYATETIPAAKELSCDYAKYSSKFWYDEKEKAIYSTTTLVLNDQKIPAGSYAAVKIFFDSVIKESAQRIVIKKM